MSDSVAQMRTSQRSGRQERPNLDRKCVPNADRERIKQINRQHERRRASQADKSQGATPRSGKSWPGDKNQRRDKRLRQRGRRRNDPRKSIDNLPDVKLARKTRASRPSSKKRVLGESPSEEDLRIVAFRPSHKFRIGEVVIAPRSRGGFSYAKIAKQTVKNHCYLDPSKTDVRYREWRVVYPNFKGAPLYKDLPSVYIGKLEPSEQPQRPAPTVANKDADEPQPSHDVDTHTSPPEEPPVVDDQLPPDHEQGDEEDDDSLEGEMIMFSGLRARIDQLLEDEEEDEEPDEGDEDEDEDEESDSSDDNDDGKPMTPLPPKEEPKPTAPDTPKQKTVPIPKPDEDVEEGDDQRRRVGARAWMSDLEKVVFSPQNAFFPDELVIVPRSAGGFTYGKIVSSINCVCQLSKEHRHPGWRVVICEKTDPRIVKDLFGVNIGKLHQAASTIEEINKLPRRQMHASGHLADESEDAANFDEEIRQMSVSDSDPNRHRQRHRQAAADRTRLRDRPVDRDPKWSRSSASPPKSNDSADRYRARAEETSNVDDDNEAVLLPEGGQYDFMDATEIDPSDLDSLEERSLMQYCQLPSSMMDPQQMFASMVAMAEREQQQQQQQQKIPQTDVFSGLFPSAGAKAPPPSSSSSSSAAHAATQRVGGLLSVPPSGADSPFGKQQQQQQGKAGPNKRNRKKRNNNNKNGGNRKTIVLDGPNLAMKHGRQKVFSMKGIKIAADYYAKRGYDVISFLPQHYATRKPASGEVKLHEFLPMADNLELLNELVDDGMIVLTPAQDYDDSYCIEYAKKHHACIVSNDRYRDHIDKQPESCRGRVARWMRDHVISYTFARDEFMPNPDFVYPSDDGNNNNNTEET